jgi:hypothetical protein
MDAKAAVLDFFNDLGDRYGHEDGTTPDLDA